MGTGAVTVNGVTLTSKADKEEFEVEFQANRLNGITKFRFKDDSSVVGGSPIDIKEQYELIVTDDAVRIFGGRIEVLEPKIDGKTVYWEGKAVSFDVLLDERVIENGLRDGATRYDDDDVLWLCAHHSELLTNSYVSRLRTAYLPTIDYTGMTVRKAIELLATYTTGAAYWVDENKQVHWQDPQSAQIVKNPGWDGGVSTNWSLDAAAVVTADAGPAGTGDYGLITTGSGSGMKESTQTITGIVANRRYLFVIDLWSSVASKAQVRLDWQNSSSVSQRIDTLTNSGATSTWARYRAIYSAPGTADRVVVRLGGVNNFTGTVRHDNAAIIGETAAWGVSTSPNGTSTFAPYGWKENRKAIQPINRVLVRGNGISGWREHAASIGYYGKKFEGAVEDNRVTTTDGIDTRAAAVFRKHAFPARTGTYAQTQSGLKAGTWQIVDIAAGPLTLQTIEWIATLRVGWLGNGKMLYAVTYGEPEEDVAAGFTAAQAAYADSGVQPGIPDPGLAGKDSTPPAIPTGLTLTTDTILTTGETIIRVIAELTHPTDVDYFGSYIEITRDNDGSDSNPQPDWTVGSMTLFLGAEHAQVAFEGAAGVTKYWARAYSVDTSGNKSAYTSVVSVTTGKDSTAPGQPTNFAATAGFRGVGLRWDPSYSADLMFVQVRWGTTGSTWPNLAETRDSVLWVSGLTPDVLHYFQVRAIDTSGNVVTSGSDETPVDYQANGEAGWTSSVTATPTNIGTADISAYSITSQMIATAGLSADVIKAGTIVVRQTGGATAIEVKDAGGVVLGKWDATNGIRIYGSDPADYAAFDDAYLRFYKDGTLTAEIGPDGVLADSIRLGALAGGHNVIPNSSFEMAAFVTGSSSVTFTSDASTPGWNATYRTTAPDNFTETGKTAITPDSLTY